MINSERRLAIVIPFYKLFFFKETLKSLDNQSCKNFKVYIGNDASPYDPKPFIEDFATRNDVRYKVFSENFGSVSLVKQWERCLDLVEDENWIMILGDDDILKPNVVESFNQFYSNFYKKSKLVRFASQVIDSESLSISTVYENPIWESPTNSYFRRLTGVTRSSLSEFIFHKESLLKFGFYDYPLGWHSDDRAWLEFPDEAPIYSINNSKVLVRYSDLSISGNGKNKEEKNRATSEHFHYLVREKFHSFNKFQRLTILGLYENEIGKIRRLKLDDWFLLFRHNIYNFNWNSFKNLFKKFLRKYKPNFSKAYE